MENKKRLIDANALADSHWWESLTNDFDKARARIIVMSAPTVDTVEVIRCKDCKRWKYDAKKLCGFCDALICYRPDYFWCMYGERRTE